MVQTVQLDNGLASRLLLKCGSTKDALHKVTLLWCVAAKLLVVLVQACYVLVDNITVLISMFIHERIKPASEIFKHLV